MDRYGMQKVESSSSARWEGIRPTGAKVRKALDLLRMGCMSPDETPFKEMTEEERIKKFGRDFKTRTSKDDYKECAFEVSSSNEKADGLILTAIDVKEEYIWGIGLYKGKTKWYLSDVVYMQILSALKEAGKDIEQFDLKGWCDITVSGETCKVAKEYIPKDGPAEEVTFAKGSEEFEKLAKTPTAKSKFYLLKDHFPSKQVTGMTLYRNRDENINIHYTIE